MGNQFSEDDILAALGSPSKVDVNKISTKPDEELLIEAIRVSGFGIQG